MASTYTSLHYHIVFCTKGRVLSIEPDWQGRLHAYLIGTVKGLGGVTLAVGGVADHVHMLVGLKPTHCVSDFMRDLKKSSSGWVHDELFKRQFGWQEGYAAFSEGASSLERLEGYIANQEEHHKKISSFDELIELCREAGIEIDRRYFE
jgi:REP element-mobilizing transposase RayT